jgi:thiosulfate/3-mercaptopyruvate sulfurtransferase|tara:strand:- start:1247 stop:2095 length:849 start_codon:yes stop_codon:yes gene_type:complete
MYSTLISSENLNSIIDDKNLIIFDCRFDLMDKNLGHSNYLKSHIKNANYINLESDLSSAVTDNSGRHPLKDLSSFSNMLNYYGINNKSQIIVYDDENSSMCARFWWMLKLVGIEKCAVLDGGYKSWVSSKFSTDNSIPKNHKKENITYSYKEEYLISTFELKNKLKDSSLYLLDARDKQRFLGNIEPIDKKAGHIPGAINMPFKENLEKDGKFKKKLDLIKLFENIDKDKSRDIINMCGSGVTACHNFLAMEYCGLRRSRIYVGSWSAWSSYNDNDIEKEQE